MWRTIDRRLFCGALSALAVGGGLPANAQAAQGLEGTWGGARNGVSAQVIVAGGSVIGFFWRDDYLETRDSRPSADGANLSFTFRQGKATLTRAGERTAGLDVDEGGHILHLELKRD